VSAGARQAVLPLFGPPQPWQTEIYRRRMVFVTIDAHPEYFRADFRDWLEKNYPVWLAFEYQANTVWDRGRRHYSARTIGEYLRHESATREAPQLPEFKLNDHWWPDLGRLYMLMYSRDRFFERRAGPATRRAA
jgi:hypothetical protein